MSNLEPPRGSSIKFGFDSTSETCDSDKLPKIKKPPTIYKKRVGNLRREIKKDSQFDIYQIKTRDIKSPTRSLTGTIACEVIIIGVLLNIS